MPARDNLGMYSDRSSGALAHAGLPLSAAPRWSSWRAGWLICACIGAWALQACAPALDWREARTQDGQLVALFPCKPERHERRVKLGDDDLPMQLIVCRADGLTFALTSTKLADPAKVTTVLTALRVAAAANLGAQTPQVSDWRLAGMTANPQSARLQLSGRGADGAVVQEEAVFFARGLDVYQVTLLGPPWPAGVAESYFGGLRFQS
jgi:hypothetical protein